MAEGFITPPALLMWPALLKPQPKFQNSTDLVYSCTLVFDAEAQKSTRYRILVEAVEALINGELAKERRSSLKLPIRDASEKEGRPGFEKGGVFFSAKSKYRPKVLDQDGALIDPDNLDAVYSGQKVLANVQPYAWKRPEGTRGISFSLNNVKIIAEGEPLDGSSVEHINKQFELAEQESRGLPF